MGSALTEAHDVISKAYSFQQEGTAKLEFLKAAQAEEERSLTDTENLSDLTSYQRSLKEKSAQALSKVSNPQLRRQLENEFELQAMQSLTKIKATQWTRMKEKNVANMNEFIIEAQAQFANGDGAALDTIVRDVNSYVKAGIISADDAQKVTAAAFKGAKKSRFTYDINNNPALTEQNLLKNTYNFDVAELDAAQKVFEQQLKVIRNDTQQSLIDMRIAGTTPKEDMVNIIKEQRKLGRIDAAFAKSAIDDIEKVTIPNVSALESVTQKNILDAKFTALKDKEWAWRTASFDDRTQFRADVFKAHSNGWIDDDQLNGYLSSNTDKYFSDPKFTNAMKAVFNTSDHYATTEKKEIAKHQMSSALMEKVGNGVDPQQALDEVVTERMAADFPGVDPISVKYTAEKRGLKVWQVYQLLNGKDKK